MKEQKTVFMSDDDGFLGRWMKLTKFVIYLIVMILWAAIGFVIWIPLIVRMILIFTGSIIAEVISTDKNYTALLEQRLNYAISFYPGGFRRIEDSIFGDPDEVTKRPDMSGDLRIILGEVIWSAVFWTITSFLLPF